MLEIFKTHQTIEQTNQINTNNFWWHCNIKMSHVFVDMTLMSKHLAKLLQVMI